MAKEKPALPRVATALACVILALDPGRKGGWAVFVAGKLTMLGTAKNARDRQRAIEAAIDHAKANGLPLIVVAEKWAPGGWKGHTALIGVGAAWGRWAEQLELAGVPKTRIVRVLPARWRLPIVKSRKKAHAVRYARARWPEQSKGHTDDALEAACMGDWGACAGEVAEAIPSRFGAF